MKRIAIFAPMFFVCAVGADEPEFSRFEARMQETRSRLRLTGEQASQIGPILQRHFASQMAVLEKYGLGKDDRGDRIDVETLRALRREMEENKTRTLKSLSGILSGEQLAEFERIQEERKKHVHGKILTKRVEDIGARLKLNEQQMKQLAPVLTDHTAAQISVLDKHGISTGTRGERKRLRFRKLRALRKDLDRVADRTAERLSDILSKKQLVEFEKMQKEQREKMRQKIRAGAQG